MTPRRGCSGTIEALNTEMQIWALMEGPRWLPTAHSGSRCGSAKYPDIPIPSWYQDAKPETALARGRQRRGRVCDQALDFLPARNVAILRAICVYERSWH